jgi:hypothetical protein
MGGHLLMSIVAISAGLLQASAFQVSHSSRIVHRSFESSATRVSSQIRRDFPRVFASKDDESEPSEQWEDEVDPEQDNNILAQFQRWLKSDEGKEDVKTYFVSLGIALLLRFTIIEPRFIPSLSMFPTFEVGDQLAVEKVTKRLKPFYRREVVVFNPPAAFREIVVDQYGQDPGRSREALIKRIIAIEVR